ncbi:MAG: hypothetical protein KUG77_25815, partial [Nannocystaceae bacterium]|nr:hypothetical protein [Nannocystaceae bacterium]
MACSEDGQSPDPAPAQGVDAQGLESSALQPLGLDLMFEEASDEFDVPVELLKGVAWVETRWHMVHADHEAHPHGQAPAYGVMALRAPRLEPVSYTHLTLPT